MSMQLSLDLTLKHQPQSQHTIKNDGWLDVSAIAHGVGFTEQVQISITLNDAFEPLQNETDGNYDQCLYDCLSMAYFHLSLDHFPCATFNFTFPRKHGRAHEPTEVGLRLRVEVQKQTTFVGLLQDF